MGQVHYCRQTLALGLQEAEGPNDGLTAWEQCLQDVFVCEKMRLQCLPASDPLPVPVFPSNPFIRGRSKQGLSHVCLWSVLRSSPE